MAGPTLPDAVRWYEGMRLTPHHFRQQDMRSEALSTRMRQLIDPLDWGVLDMAISFNGPELRLTALQAIMPDGQYVELPDGGEALIIDLAKATPGRDDVLEISLMCTPLPASTNEPASGDEARTLVRSAGGGADDGPLDVLRPRLKLVSGTPSRRSADDLLPLARVHKIGAEYRPDEGHIAPWRLVRPACSLAPRRALLLEQLATTYRTLKGRCDRAPRDPLQRPWLVALLGAHLMELGAQEAGLAVHPRELYLQLCKLLGTVSVVDPEMKYPSALPFEYRDLGRCMTPLFDAISACLKRIAPEFDEARFDGNAADGYSINLTEIADADQYYIGLDCAEGASAADMAAWLKDAVIGRTDQFADLTRTRSSGIVATPMPAEIAARFGANPFLSVFRLEHVGARHPDFVRDAVLKVVGPRSGNSSSVPLKLVLMGKPRAAASTAGTA